MSVDLTGPDGTRIVIRPIQADELDRIPLRCWPGGPDIDRLFAEQETIGLAAWEGGTCVAELHGYRVMPPSGPASSEAQSFEGMTSAWWDLPWPDALQALAGPVWCHACIHVGRTLETFCAEMLQKFVLPEADREGWDDERVQQELIAHVPNANVAAAGRVLDDIRSNQPAIPVELDSRYAGRGIGTALCAASVQWATERDYTAVLALASPADLHEFAMWSGHLPWTTYAKLGFEVAGYTAAAGDMPDWAKGDSPPPVMAQVDSALAAGRAPDDLRERWMVRRLKETQ